MILEAESIEIEAWFTVRPDADEAFREWAVEEGYGGQNVSILAKVCTRNGRTGMSECGTCRY